MTVKDSANGMTGADLWKWLLGGAITIAVALGMFALSQLAQANTTRLDRLERSVDQVQDQRAEDAGEIRELKSNLSNISWRLDRIDAKLDQALGKP